MIKRSFSGLTPITIKTAYRSKIHVRQIYPDRSVVTIDPSSGAHGFQSLNTIYSSSGNLGERDKFVFEDLYSTGTYKACDRITEDTVNNKIILQKIKKTFIFELNPSPRGNLAVEDFRRIVDPVNISKDSPVQQFNIYLGSVLYPDYVRRQPNFDGSDDECICTHLPYANNVASGRTYGFTTRVNNQGQGFLIIGLLKSDFLPPTAIEVTEKNALKQALLDYLQYPENSIKFLYGMQEEFYEVENMNDIYLKSWANGSIISAEPNNKAYVSGDYQSEDEDLRLEFFSCLSEDIVVDKTKYLENKRVFYGTLRNTCSILYPIIQVQSEEYLHFNYCYIPTFRRWYHVENIVSVNKNLWEFTMTVDVLMSHKDEILGQEALIGRNEFEWNDMLVDNNIKCEYAYDIVNKTVLGFATYRNREDELNIANFGYNYSYALSCVASVGLDNYADTNRYGLGSSFNFLYFLNDPAFVHTTSKIADPTYLESLSKMFENPSDSIRYMKLLPFDLTFEFSEDLSACNLYGLEMREIFVGNGRISLDEDDEKLFMVLPSYMSPIVLTFCNGHKYIKEDGVDEYTPIKIDKYYNSFLDYAPYTQIELFLPYIGFVEVDPLLVMGKEFYISYVIDPNSFECDVILVSKDGLPKNPQSRIPWVYPTDVLVIWHGNISSDIPLGGNNKNEMYKQLTNIGVQLGATAAGVATSLSFGSASARDVGKQKKKGTSLKSRQIWRNAQQEAVEIGVSGLSNTMNSLINNTPHGYTSSCGNGANSRIYGTHMFFRIRRIKAEYPSNYNHLYGRPLFETKKLSEVHGFTTVENMHVEDFMATNDEKEEIITALETGVILP